MLPTEEKASVKQEELISDMEDFLHLSSTTNELKIKIGPGLYFGAGQKHKAQRFSFPQNLEGEQQLWLL